MRTACFRKVGSVRYRELFRGMPRLSVAISLFSSPFRTSSAAGWTISATVSVRTASITAILEYSYGAQSTTVSVVYGPSLLWRTMICPPSRCGWFHIRRLFMLVYHPKCLSASIIPRFSVPAPNPCCLIPNHSGDRRLCCVPRFLILGSVRHSRRWSRMPSSEPPKSGRNQA